MKIPEWFMDHLLAATGRRSRIVIEHILKYGHITTEELKEKYGYGHPLRWYLIPSGVMPVRSASSRRVNEGSVLR